MHHKVTVHECTLRRVHEILLERRLLLGVLPRLPMALCPKGEEDAREDTHEPCPGIEGEADKGIQESTYVIDARKMLSIAPSSAESNSFSDCCAKSPSTSAREKLATMPWLRARRALAASRG